MDERSSRIFVGLCLLVLVWIGVYWMWEPEQDDPPRITFPGAVEEPSEQKAVVRPEPEPEPVLLTENPAVNQVENRVERQPVIPPEIIMDLDAERHATRVIPPEFTTHTVREFETMGSIAKNLWGSSAKWEVISRANPSVDPERLRVGMVLRIPVDPDNVQGKVVRDDRGGGTAAEPTPKVVEYFVQSGDSLSRIAQRFYGSSRYADFIYDYNRSTLKSRDDLRIGQLLKLPPLDEAEQPGG